MLVLIYQAFDFSNNILKHLFPYQVWTTGTWHCAIVIASQCSSTFTPDLGHWRMYGIHKTMRQQLAQRFLLLGISFLITQPYTSDYAALCLHSHSASPISEKFHQNQLTPLLRTIHNPCSEKFVELSFLKHPHDPVKQYSASRGGPCTIQGLNSSTMCINSTSTILSIQLQEYAQCGSSTINDFLSAGAVPVSQTQRHLITEHQVHASKKKY